MKFYTFLFFVLCSGCATFYNKNISLSDVVASLQKNIASEVYGFHAIVTQPVRDILFDWYVNVGVMSHLGVDITYISPGAFDNPDALSYFPDIEIQRGKVDMKLRIDESLTCYMGALNQKDKYNVSIFISEDIQNQLSRQYGVVIHFIAARNFVYWHPINIDQPVLHLYFNAGCDQATDPEYYDAVISKVFHELAHVEYALSYSDIISGQLIGSKLTTKNVVNSGRVNEFIASKLAVCNQVLSRAFVDLYMPAFNIDEIKTEIQVLRNTNAVSSYHSDVGNVLSYIWLAQFADNGVINRVQTAHGSDLYNSCTSLFSDTAIQRSELFIAQYYQ